MTVAKFGTEKMNHEAKLSNHHPPPPAPHIFSFDICPHLESKNKRKGWRRGQDSIITIPHIPRRHHPGRRIDAMHHPSVKKNKKKNTPL